MGPIVVLRDLVKDADVGLVKLEDGCGIEESSVEVFDGMLPKDALPLAHCLKEHSELAKEAASIEAVLALKEIAKDVTGQKSDRVRKETEKNPHEKVRHLLG